MAKYVTVRVSYTMNDQINIVALHQAEHVCCPTLQQAILAGIVHTLNAVDQILILFPFVISVKFRC